MQQVGLFGQSSCKFWFLDYIPFFLETVKENGPIVHFKLLGRHYVLLNDPDDIKVSQLYILILYASNIYMYVSCMYAQDL